MAEDLFGNVNDGDLFSQFDAELDDLFPDFNPPTPKNKENINEEDRNKEASGKE